MSSPQIHQAAHYHVEDLGEDLAESKDEQVIKQCASALVSKLKGRGDELIKLQLAPSENATTFYAILDAARHNNMPVVGHLPYTVDSIQSLG